MTTEALPKDLKKGLLAKIHIAKKDLQLGDDDYRSLLEGVTGLRSCKDMTTTQLNAVLDRFRELGWVPQAKAAPTTRCGKKKRIYSPTSRHKPEYLKTQRDKIVALWIQAYQCEAVKDRSDTALQQWINHSFKVRHIRWLNQSQCHTAIEVLKKMIKAKGGGDAGSQA